MTTSMQREGSIGCLSTPRLPMQKRIHPFLPSPAPREEALRPELGSGEDGSPEGTTPATARPFPTSKGPVLRFLDDL
ncbi:uncharacterized protein THITE_2109180 [Thermothielavioides terrestris NRRL 8126]|uniref:Uncharacterized protein n=1 Tax=Thermothielavioides terrestris (strain ATCC 38088 / NRRL 8126) TaxID=578455 RepID=G2QTY8_THETT|nr:uncharacterized protein THITE_2109180 [Thermothielavioides terrestris NRRL 8126]AEO63647.1 hypothetical protein THITE_2109180 [Thermothielavioides terrestris NRRL 8126]